MNMNRRIRIVDTTLRDGSHAVKHQFELEDIERITSALNDANVYAIEISHGDGLAGSSIQYGWAKHSDDARLAVAQKVVDRSKITVLLLPGIGTRDDLKLSIERGAQVARIATHVTEADISEQHIRMAKDMGLEVMTFLMLAHMEPPEKMLEQAKLMEGYGADVVYVVDSAGAMIPDDVKVRIGLLKKKMQVEVGFHGHNNLGLAIGNTIAAVQEGATVIDGTLGGLGAGAGNAPTEVLAAVLDKMGYVTGIDLYKIMDAAEDIVRPIMRRPQVIDRSSLILGYAGVYSSFLLHTYRAVEKFDVDPRDVLVELGRRRVVGGQEDMIIDVAHELSQKKNR
ncbi:MAG: 4-hydroxy-2-oxopentanoic acid aldolase [Spirochaetes bacterium DG_61]|nr:MAG: 4-hydroxy-2-oxopentanoic acid aldolase [Spirochaetes bacterium DG_61]